MARVRRFLSVSLGRRHPHPPAPRKSPPLACTSPPPPPPGPLNQLVTQAASVLGLPLDQVMSRQGVQGGEIGVPMVVHVLCCYMLTHGK